MTGTLRCEKCGAELPEDAAKLPLEVRPGLDLPNPPQRVYAWLPLTCEGTADAPHTPTQMKRRCRE